MRQVSLKDNFYFWLGICILIGILFRLWLIIRSDWRIDYDEGMIGLLGLRVMRGQWMAFIPAQPTLGALEAYLLAPVFVILGVSTLTFRIVSLLFSGVYILTTGLVGRAAFDWQVGVLAGLLAALAPPYMIIVGLKTWGSTIETIVFGNMLLLSAAYVLESADRARNMRLGFAVMGFAAGLMFWAAWLGFYYFIPVGVLLLWKGRAQMRSYGWIALIGFCIGSLPFWIDNLQNDFATFTTVFGGSRSSFGESLRILRHFGRDLLPRLVTGDSHWGIISLPGKIVLVILYYAGILVLLAERRLWHSRKGYSLRWMLIIFVIALPLIYLNSSYSRNALNPWGVDATGRYVVMLHTALPIGLAVLIACITRLQKMYMRWAGFGIISLVLLLNVWGMLRLNPQRAFDSPYYNRMPDSLTPLIDYLHANHITHIWTDVGIAHVLMFETEESILAADYYDSYIAGGLIRFPDVLEKVENAPYVVFVEPVSSANPPIEQALDAAGIAYHVDYVVPNLAVYVPEESIDPAQIAAGLGYQY